VFAKGRSRECYIQSIENVVSAFFKVDFVEGR